MSKRAEYMYALYAGSLAEPGDRNPYSGKSLLLAKLWRRGYMRMMQVRIEAGPAMQAYRAGQAKIRKRSRSARRTDRRSCRRAP